MEKMNQELNLDNYDIRAIKKIYNDAVGTNIFLNQFTLLDVEDAKKKLTFHLSRKYNYSNLPIINQFVDNSSKILADELFKTNEGNNYNTQMVGVKNIIKDPRKLNQTYFNETYRIINIDSMYRTNLWSANTSYDSKSSTDMLIQLNDTLDNVVSLELTNLCIPFTFFNIDSAYGNNYFYVQKQGVDDSLVKIEVSSGNYTKSTLITAINNALDAETTNNVNDIDFAIDSLTSKVTISLGNANAGTYDIIFYDYLDQDQNFSNNNTSQSSPDVQSKLNNNLGWILGFRKLDKTNISMEYSVTLTDSIVSETICFIPYTKYFVIVIDDMNKNQTNKGLVQISNDKQFIKPTKYFNNQDNSLNCITDGNFDNYVNDANRKMTKNQLYSSLQINNYKNTINNKNGTLNSNMINNVFAIIPFESKSLVWGESMITSDKNKFKRKYNGPVNINKLNIKLLDDKGNIVNLNGSEWALSMISTHLYQH